MKLQVTTNAEAVEKANYILSQSLQHLRENKDVMQDHGLSHYDIMIVETFRKQVLKSFLKSAKK